MADFDNDHDELLVHYFGENPVITNSVFPEFPISRPHHGFANAAWVFKSGKTIKQESYDPFGTLWVDLVNLPFCSGRKLNGPRHIVS